jgi:hypothetical protein
MGRTHECGQSRTFTYGRANPLTQDTNANANANANAYANANANANENANANANNASQLFTEWCADAKHFSSNVAHSDGPERLADETFAHVVRALVEPCRALTSNPCEGMRECRGGEKCGGGGGGGGGGDGGGGGGRR